MKQKIKIKCQLFIFIFGAILFLLIPSSTLAVETGVLGLVPAHPNPNNPTTASWFIYEAKPGTVIEDSALIKNHDVNNPVTVRIYAVDGVTTTNGVFSLSLATDQQSGIGAWVEVLPPEDKKSAKVIEEAQGSEKPIGLMIEIPAGQNVEVPFKLKVPDNASVGDFTGGLVIEAAPTKAEGTAFNVVTRIGARVYLNVPGEKIFSLKIKEFFWNRVDYTSEELKRLFLGQVQRFLGLYRKGAFSVKLENLGNVRLGTLEVPLKGKLVISNIVNQIIDENELELGTILPKGEITQSFTLKRNNPLFSRYKADLEVTYAKDIPSEKATIYFWVIPWPAIISLGGIIVLLIIIWLVIKLIRIKLRSKMIKYVVQKDDTPEKIAKHFGVSLKKLVKINKIKAEKPIKDGQTIFIPPSNKVPDPADLPSRKF